MKERHSAKTLIAIGILTVLIAFMDISGLPSTLFVDIELADIDPIYFALAINFIIIGVLAFVVLKLFAPDWRLGLRLNGLREGLCKFAVPGVLAGLVTAVGFCIGLPFDSSPTIWKVIFEGIVYYAGVALVEELYVRGLFLNLVEDLAYKSSNRTNIAIAVSAVVFGLGHIPGMLGQDWLVIAFKVISTIGMGLYFGVAYKRSGNLWVPVIMHWFIDVCALPYCFTTFSGYPTISLVILIIVYTALGVYSVAMMVRR